MTKQLIIGLIISLTIGLSSSISLSGETTSLSKKAAKLNVGMSRKTVLRILGNPTWAVIPENTGDFALFDHRIALELYWKNLPCSPVVVQFDAGYRVTGWDEGRSFCGDNASLLEPSEDYSCNKSDRSKYCK